jgi:probable addiction module antidote protein
MGLTKDYREYLIERLRDPKKALAYLNAALEDCRDDSQESRQVLLEAFRTVIQAQGGLTLVSKKANLDRQSLYRSLSRCGNPRLTTLSTRAHAMGFEFKLSLPPKR